MFIRRSYNLWKNYILSDITTLPLENYVFPNITPTSLKGYTCSKINFIEFIKFGIIKNNKNNYFYFIIILIQIFTMSFGKASFDNATSSKRLHSAKKDCSIYLYFFSLFKRTFYTIFLK